MTILDTNVLSELMRSQPSPSVVNWVASQPADELCATSITEAEIFYGIELLPRGKRRDRLFLLAEGLFGEDLKGRVIGFEGGFESDAARVFGKISAARRGLGRPISHADAQIAAIARTQRARLATRDVADFEDCGIELVDPWESA